MHIEVTSLYSFIRQTWIYYQARDEYYTGKLETININKTEVSGKEEYSVFATFQDRRRTIQVSFTVDSFGNVRHTCCSCKNKRKDVGCIHLIAVVEAINELEPTSFPFQINYQDFLKEKQRQKELEWARMQMAQTNNELFGLLDKMQSEKIAKLISSSQEQIHIHIDLEGSNGYEGIFNLGFSIGTDKMYRVKDLASLAKGFSKQDVYALGKSNSIQLKRELLDEYSVPILDFISSYAQAHEWKRTAYVTEEVIDDAFEMVNKLPADYYDFYVFDHTFQFPFKIEKRDESYLFEIDEDRLENKKYILGKKHLYTIENRDLHRYKLDDDGQVGNLVNFVNEKDRIFIKNENMKDFYLRVIQPNLNYLKINSDFDLSIFETSISDIRIYSDLEDTQLKVWGKYYQDGQEKQLFDPAKSPVILNIEAIVKNYANSIKDNTALFKTRGSKLNGFLDKGLPLLMEQAKVYVSEELMQLKNRKAVNLNVGVQMKNNLLEMTIDTNDISKDELIHILNAYRRKRKFYRLQNGQTVDLEQESVAKLDDLSNQLNLTSKDLKKDTIQKPAYQALHLDDVDMKIRNDESINSYSEKLEKVKEETLELPEKYKEILRPYQVEGIEWLNHLHTMELNGILADDMGLGKTLQVLIYLENFVDKTNPILIVCPSSLMYNWESEIKKFDLNLDYICVSGSQEERKRRIAEKHDVYITTYDYIKRDLEYYQKTTFEYLILDEAQYIKNPKTQNATSVKTLKSNHRLALTGTPIENSLTELWSIFDFLLPGYLYGLSYFVKTYEKPIRQDHNEKKQNQLKKLVEPFILRRTKATVLTDLPDKVEKEMWLEFNESEKNLYLANLAKINEELRKQLELEHMDSILVLSMMTRLRQICCEPRMLYDTITEPSTKLMMCVDLIQTLKENNKKVLLFSSFTTIFDMLIEEFNKNGITYHILTGQTNKEKRREEVNDFQSDDSDVFLISLKAGGTGLNLTSAQAVIHFDPWWNISAQNQATDRAYRIGQTENVLVYQLLMKNSIEEKIFELQRSKKELNDLFVENSSGGISTLSKEELKDLFKTK